MSTRKTISVLRSMGLTFRAIDRALWGRRTNGTRSFRSNRAFNTAAAARRLHTTHGLSFRQLDVALFDVDGNGTRSFRTVNS